MMRFVLAWLTVVVAGTVWGQTPPFSAPSSSSPATSSPALSTAAGIATAAAVEGTVFVTRIDGKQSLLQRGSSLQRGETINTTRNSSVRLRFSDGGETVVRPESALVVQEYQFKKEAPAEDSLVMRLIRGGLRAVTGAVGKRGDVNAYQLQISTATIGIRGTDYSARLCQNDCSEQPASTQRNSSTPVAARAVQIVGVPTLLHAGQPPVPLTAERAIYTGDTIETPAGAYAVLVFRDNTRVTINPTSRFVITRYSYDPDPKAEPGSIFIELLKGGLRFATGVLGKRDPSTVKLRTATSTIGIRGTVFDLACAPGAAPDGASEAEMGSMPCDQSLFAQTRDGTIALAGDQGDELLVSAGQSARVDGPGNKARPLSAPPRYFIDLQSPEPEKVTATPEQLFGADAADGSQAGVYLTVHEGRVVLAQQQRDITLDAGESAFAGSSLVPVRLFSTPAVLDRDPFLSGGMFKANMCRR